MSTGALGAQRESVYTVEVSFLKEMCYKNFFHFFN